MTAYLFKSWPEAPINPKMKSSGQKFTKNQFLKSFRPLAAPMPTVLEGFPWPG